MTDVKPSPALRKGVAEKRRGRAGAGRKPNPSPFQQSWITRVHDAVDARTGRAITLSPVELDFPESGVKSVRLHTAYLRRELTKAAKRWAQEHQSKFVDAPGVWPTLGMTVTEKMMADGAVHYSVSFWHERTKEGSARYSR
jgi:hypothetical protein